MTHGYAYLASPYSHENPVVEEVRYIEACRVAAKLMVETDQTIFSPIAHSHPIGQFLPSNCGKFWKKQDVPLLRHADKLIVLKLHGWDKSEGVAWEMALAKELLIPIEYIDP